MRSWAPIKNEALRRNRGLVWLEFEGCCEMNENGEKKEFEGQNLYSHKV